jgi:hypothetical protein
MLRHRIKITLLITWITKNKKVKQFSRTSLQRKQSNNLGKVTHYYSQKIRSIQFKSLKVLTSISKQVYLISLLYHDKIENCVYNILPNVFRILILLLYLIMRNNSSIW